MLNGFLLHRITEIIFHIIAMNLCSGVVFDTDDECVFLVLCQVGCRYKIKKALIVVVFYQYEVRKNQRVSNTITMCLLEAHQFPKAYGI